MVLAQRNERCEGNWNDKGHVYVANLVDEVARAKKAGYRRILVAGQSYGAGTALGASAKSKDIDGVMAFALSHGRGSCRDPRTFRPDMVPFHEEKIKTGIEESIAPRILISMGRDDHCVGVTFTAGGRARRSPGRAPRTSHFDESMRQTGHGAAVSTQFASDYGSLRHRFLRSRRRAAQAGRHVVRVREQPRPG